jgi:SAM-dependent methyltransferase
LSQPDWNARFSEAEFAYGTEPNSFLAQNANWLRDPVLSIAEGEGRNAVFLATRGLHVHAVDGSKVGLAKADKLAASKGVTISTEVADLRDFAPEPNAYGGVVSIFAHLPSSLRTRLYPLLVRSLKPGGILILESYSENQMGRGTGGPSNLDLLMTCKRIEQEFFGLETILLQEIEREVIEGKLHTGVASVIQYIGKKPS